MINYNRRMVRGQFIMKIYTVAVFDYSSRRWGYGNGMYERIDQFKIQGIFCR